MAELKNPIGDLLLVVAVSGIRSFIAFFQLVIICIFLLFSVNFFRPNTMSYFCFGSKKGEFGPVSGPILRENWTSNGAI